MGILPGTGDVGPFGRYRDGEPDDDELDGVDEQAPAGQMVAAVVEERVRARIADASRRREARTAGRAELAERRSAGLRARRRARTRNLPPKPPPDAA